MTDAIAISARGLGKRYRRGAEAEQHSSLRDVLVTGAQKLLRGKLDTSKTEFWALKDASFDIRRGENVGIIGLNGAGKSTLLKMLSRITTPTEGRATITGRLGALLEVGTGFHRELTGRENVFLYGAILGMTHAEVSSKFDAIVEFSEIRDFIDTPVKHYSSGMYVRLAFSVAAHLDPDILLLDEVLAVGDFSFQKKCMDFTRRLESAGATILFVSHNMFSIKSMCERVIYLKGGRVVFDGPTDEGLKLYEDDSRMAQAPWFNRDEKKSKKILFTDVRILDETSSPRTLFEYGDRLRLEVSYELLERMTDPDIRIGIDRADHVWCSTFSSAADSFDLSSMSSSGVLTLVTPPLKLTADMYTIAVVARERGDIINAQIAGTFHVRHSQFSSNGFGVFHEPGDWSVSQAQSGQLSDQAGRGEHVRS